MSEIMISLSNTENTIKKSREDVNLCEKCVMCDCCENCEAECKDKI